MVFVIFCLRIFIISSQILELIMTVSIVFESLFNVGQLEFNYYLLNSYLFIYKSNKILMKWSRNKVGKWSRIQN